MRLLVFVPLMVVLLTTSASARTTSPQAPAKFTPADIQAFTSAVTKQMSSERVPGVNVGVWVPGQGTWVHSFGLADRKTRARMRLPLHIRIASITKTFVATATLQLVDKGRLSLDDHLGKFVKNIPNGDKITIREVLGMTAGIYDYTRDAGFTKRFDRNRLASWSPARVLQIVRKHGADFAPGQKVSYSDSNYVLLGLIIEKLTKQSVEKVVKARILNRLGMKHTSFPTRPPIPKPYAHGYYAGQNGKGALRDFTAINPDLAWTAGAMISTLGDLRVWGQALATGKLLKPATHAAQLQFREIPNPGGPYIGYGLGAFNIAGFVGHNGAIFGFNSAMFYLPKAHATIVVQLNKSTNFSGDATAIFFGIGKHLFPDQFKR
jgi:D-alanyl-D-alanine carboxypeptidase